MSTPAAGTRLYLRALLQDGAPAACRLVELVARDAADAVTRTVFPAAELDAWQRRLPRELRARAAALRAGLAEPRPWVDRPRIMGILNVTPDSFSDGGEHAVTESAVAHGLRLVEEGADTVDVGGESTRPGAVPVPVEEELRRVLPVVEGLAARDVLVSIDTRRARVMREAVVAGARIINDVSALTHDPESLATAAAGAATIVLMHMRGEPATMNLAPGYRHCSLEVFDDLEERVRACVAAGIPRARLIVDPGLCFAKHEPHNLALLRDLALFQALGCALLIGVSRKGWTAAIEERWRPRERLPSSLAAAQWSLDRGARILRVHDVAATRQMVDAWAALAGLGGGED
ncbi:MAG TPA: dihydropteroate synthase [Geminicoccaceae bacterium]|nr:dihydropteroate synthase [Geminicoccaceae bacterium]